MAGASGKGRLQSPLLVDMQSPAMLQQIIPSRHDPNSCSLRGCARRTSPGTLVAATVAVALVGTSAPLPKLLLGQTTPQLLAGLLYLWSGHGWGPLLLMIGLVPDAGLGSVAVPQHALQRAGDSTDP